MQKIHRKSSQKTKTAKQSFQNSGKYDLEYNIEKTIRIINPQSSMMDHWLLSGGAGLIIVCNFIIFLKYKLRK